MQALLRWYQKYRRALPWRETRDGYRIFISELMLQQTQVERVIPKYLAWLKQFPTWRKLATATTADLLHAWAGLGYNRRALQAREAARFVVAHQEPIDELEWRSLKGVGPYTAAALTEFVNHKRAVVIDTNVRRVAGRILLGICYPDARQDTRLQRLLKPIIDRCQKHWELPQAMMDLASTICTVTKPACSRCPIRNDCRAAKKFLRSNPPLKPKGTAPVESRHRDKPYPDRIYRGRILKWIREQGPTEIKKLGKCIDENYEAVADLEWIQAMVRRLVKDGLICLEERMKVSLPKEEPPKQKHP